MRSTWLQPSPRLARLGTHVVAPALAVLTLGGCVVAPPYAVAPAPYGYAEASAPPPPPQYEVVGAAPYPGYFWITGNWVWGGGRYAWHPGYWQAPRPGYRWAPQRWVRHGGVWRAQGGYWERR